MITVEDVKKLKKVFATKDDLKKLEKSLIKRFLDAFITRDEFQYEFKKIRTEMATRKDLERAIEKLDEVLTEVKDVRQEQTAHYAQHDRISDRLDKIEATVI